MKKFLRLFALCTMFMVSAFTHPALADAPFTTKTVQVIDKSTGNGIEDATVEITSPESQQQKEETDSDGYCSLKRKTDKGTPEIIIRVSHNDYITTGLKTSWGDTTSVLKLSQKPQNITLSGTVIGADPETRLKVQPIVGATISWGPTTNESAATDNDGKFEVTIPRGSTITISAFDYENYTRTYQNTTRDIKIQLVVSEEKGVAMEEVIVSASEKCTPEQLTTGIASGIYRNNKCWPTACKANYLLMNNSKQAPINSSEIENASNKGDFLISNNAACIKETNCHSNNSIGITASKWQLNSRQTKYECIITECNENAGYTLNKNRNECKSVNECKPDAKTHPHATAGKYVGEGNNRKCVITECEKGYTPNKDGSECVGIMVLPEDKSASRIGELETLYNTAHDNETSIANKILGTASMAATGSGGMMLASGLTEQKADKEAEEKMRGYVATFKCNYGNTNVEYGTQPTELPTSTELYNLYAEYVTLANDLKLRKDVLGMRAGIESEPILNSATSGLYDDVSSGRSAGMYTSLARAILDPNGADAAAWAEQTKKSKNLVIAGATTAGVGVIGSIVGNVLINKGAPNLQYVREEIDKINKKYKEFYKEFKKIADDLDGTLTMENDADKDEDEPEPMGGNDNPPQNGEKPVENNDTTKCPDDAPGTYPDCECIDKENKVYDQNNNQCKDKVAPIDTPDLPLTDATMNTAGADLKTTATDITLSIPGSTLFDTGDYEIKDKDAKASLLQLIDALNTLNTTLKQASYNVTITAHTDTEGGINSKGNQTLSLKRANAVKDLLSEATQRAGLTLNITSSGKAGTECTCASGLTEDSTETEFNNRQKAICEEVKKYFTKTTCCADATDYATAKDIEIPDNTKFEPCRRVDITFELPSIDASLLASYGITGTGNKTLTLTQIQKLAAKATAGDE